MLNRTAFALAFAVVATSMSAVAGQMWANKTEQLGTTPGGSPKVRTEWALDTATVSVTYSRPSLKGRTLNDVVTPNTPWKASDDEPAVLTSSKPMIFGNVTIPAGTYSLWVIPQGESWSLAINKATTGAYQQAQDVGRIGMKVDKLEKPVDQHMLQIAPSTDRVSGGAEVRIDFGNVRAAAPFIIRR